MVRNDVAVQGYVGVITSNARCTLGSSIEDVHEKRWPSARRFFPPAHVTTI